MSELQLHEGLGSFVFSDIAAPTGALHVFFFAQSRPSAGLFGVKRRFDCRLAHLSVRTKGLRSASPAIAT